MPTVSARRHLGQMCGHFRHRRPVSNEGDTGRFGFEGGDCVMRVGEGAPLLRTEAIDDANRARLEHVPERHLERFTFREVPTLSWTRTDEPSASGLSAPA